MEFTKIEIDAIHHRVNKIVESKTPWKNRYGQPFYDRKTANQIAIESINMILDMIKDKYED